MPPATELQHPPRKASSDTSDTAVVGLRRQESTDPSVDVFDREAVWVKNVLTPLVRSP